MLLKGQTLALAAILGLAEIQALVETLTLKETGSGGSGGFSADSSLGNLTTGFKKPSLFFRLEG